MKSPWMSRQVRLPIAWTRTGEYTTIAPRRTEVAPEQLDHRGASSVIVSHRSIERRGAPMTGQEARSSSS